MRGVICHRLSIWFRSMICIAFRSTEPGGFALLAGDASVNSWFREICSTSLACLFNEWIPFSRKKKPCLSIGVRVRLQPPTLPLYYEGKVKKTIFPQDFVYILRTQRTRHMVSFIDFYFHFLANFQT